MGNYRSCALAAPETGKHTSKATTKVIFPCGEIKQFHKPIKAADLMLELPNFFVINSNSLHAGRRLSAAALNADQDLEMANVYVMFPMKRFNSVITTADMAPLSLATNSVSNRPGCFENFRILPESGDMVPPVAQQAGSEEPNLPKLNLEEIQDVFSPEFEHRMSMCRSKKPLLETINEEPVCSLRALLVQDSK